MQSNYHYFYYHDYNASVYNSTYDSGHIVFDLTGPGEFGIAGMLWTINETMSISNATTGAPEIDGGKLPLAALLLGLVAVITQRKRMAALVA